MIICNDVTIVVIYKARSEPGFKDICFTAVSYLNDRPFYLLEKTWQGQFCIRSFYNAYLAYLKGIIAKASPSFCCSLHEITQKWHIAS
jgi:hypothetical protein